MEIIREYPLLIQIIDSYIIAISYFFFWFIYSIYRKRNDVADVAWGMGFVFIALGSMMIKGNYSPNVLLVSILVAFWGIRLFSHIAARNAKKEEDIRYKNWRDSWKYVKTRSFFQIYLLQATLMTLVSMSVIVNATFNFENLNIFSLVGALIWIIGYGFEVIGDKQLKDFVGDSKNKGKIMDKGFWKYTRHPNYFGEVVLWWGIFIISIPAGYWWLSMLGPITITVLILRVSGIPLTERHFEGRPGWKEYKGKTSIFFPLPQKK
jgi:steroid 5-alpha reductase family enzyme